MTRGKMLEERERGQDTVSATSNVSEGESPQKPHTFSHVASLSSIRPRDALEDEARAKGGVVRISSTSCRQPRRQRNQR